MTHDRSARRLTRAAKEIEGLGEKQDALAERWGITTRTLQRWLAGDRTPKQADRERVCLAGGPRPEAWDELLPIEAPAPRAPGPLEPATAEGVREMAARLYRLANQELEELETPGEGVDATKRLAQLKQLGALVVQLGDLTGAVILDEKRIAASPAWARLTARLTEALVPFPDAAAAVQATFEEAVA